MEEEVGIKVTRLRRRLSVEAEDVKSPSTQSTPTKKRGGRLAAKPQLELIDENATDADKPKSTRKSTVRDAETDEKAVTPARRSTRVRSNTSLVSESVDAEDKGTPSKRNTRIRSNTSLVAEPEDKGTPSKRSARIRSNTSLIAETVAQVDSPRAKRAARRTSQVGSDNETVVTPARQTRRTKTDSTPKQVDPSAGKLGTQIAEVIVEESENNVKDTKNKDSPAKDTKNESPTVRKSPRLIEKTGGKRKSQDNDNKENESETIMKTDDRKTDAVDGSVASSMTKVDLIDVVAAEDAKLIKELDGQPTKSIPNLNKTASEIEETTSKSKRHRTKSWTTITSSPSSDNAFLSDTETIKKKNKRKSITDNSFNISASGDGLLNSSKVKENKEQEDIKEISLNSSIDKETKKRKSKSMTLDTETPINEISIVNEPAKLDNSTAEMIASQTDSNYTAKFFSEAPVGKVESVVYIEDSDSNTGSTTKETVNKELDSGDQCVPVVEHNLDEENIKVSKDDLSYEPMDIDETLPNNITLSDFTEKNTSVVLDEKELGLNNRKSLLNISQVHNVSIDTINKSLNKSRKKSLSSSDDIMDKSVNKSNRKSLIGTTISDENITGLNVVTAVDDINIKSNKSQRKSSIGNEQVNTSIFNDSASNQSKRTSSISNLVIDEDMDINSSNTALNDDVLDKGLNKSKRNSTISKINDDVETNKDAPITTANAEILDKSLNKSKRKSSVSKANVDIETVKDSSSIAVNDEVMDKSLNKSKRKSSISKVNVEIETDKDSSNIAVNEEVLDKSLNKSKGKSSISTVNDDIEMDQNTPTTAVNDEMLDKSLNKSKRKSSISKVDDNDINKNTSKAEGVDVNIVNKSLNKSKRKSTSTVVNEDTTDSNDNNINNSLNQSKRKSANADDIIEDEVVTKRKSLTSNVGNDEVDSSLNRSKLNSNTISDTNVNNSANGSKRKSSSSHTDSQTFDKSSNENKSTLVLSQLKDTSDTNVETNGPKDVYEFNDSSDQLSKSVNVPNINNDKVMDKKNLSLTYSTSTPLQQKSLKKLGMQINTSIIAPNSVTKTEEKRALNRSKSKKEALIISQDDESEAESESGSDEEEEEDSEDGEEEETSNEEEESVQKSKMIDDEAEEASDNYESGDSRDDEEREYEEQNEVVEKGETLDSQEEDFSDDSDYEKDSFIVDSDEEDDELLSGSGDDLSTSANELSMSAKSKKKFNERKVKEQKKASREMFEARHKLNENQKLKSKKGGRQQLQSSDSESESEAVVQPKKHRRARIDSSQDISINQSDADKSISKKKKKVKRLSESVCEDDAANEREITMHVNIETSDKPDPLSLKHVVKEEPKTPQKDLNISTVAITNIEEVEEVQVDGNVSIMKSNETIDPLQSTMVQDNEEMDEDDDESISENEEITNNYESVLNALKKNAKKVKSMDISLNLDKKTKEKVKEPIVDQLNLTQSKSKKKKCKVAETSLSVENKVEKKNVSFPNKSVNIQDEGSSDSIDMKLLFNEDSNDSEEKITANKEIVVKNDETVDDFIPLKKSEGKTNMLETIDITVSKDNSVLNVSKSKKNKRKSALPEETAAMDNDEGEHVNFFIDTTGTQADLNQSVANTSVKGSAKKNKQKNVSVVNIEEGKDDASSDTPIEISFHSKKNLNNSKQAINTSRNEDTKLITTASESAKKNKKSLNSSQNVEEQIKDLEDITVSKDNSVLNVSKSKKNKRKSAQLEETAAMDNDEGEHVNFFIDTTGTQADLNQSVANTSVKGSAKKNKQKNVSFVNIEEAKDDATNDAPIEVSFRSEKNLDNSKQDFNSSQNEDTKLNTTASESAKKKKKNKKSLNHSQNVEEQIKDLEEPAHNTSAGSAKKPKQKPVLESIAIQNVAEATEVILNEETTSKKRKRKPSSNPSMEEEIKDDVKHLDTSKSLNESVLTSNKKKKRKVSNKEDEIDQTQVPEVQQTDEQEKPVSNKNKKKNKALQETVPDEIDDGSTKKNKKRKERDDDDGQKLSKVIKQSSFDKVHVPRLPVNVLKQLDDKPRDIESKADIISTTSFTVEQARKRKNKPSNYLEQSVYLNDSIEEKPKKSSLKRPKVLPFVPTASTSDSGFTTQFRVNVIPQETQFIAQSSDTGNFKKDMLNKNRIKKLGTFEMYKRHRSIKISKF